MSYCILIIFNVYSLASFFTFKHSTADLSLFSEVANEGGGLVGGERVAEGIGEGVGKEITTNIRLSRCNEIDALRHKGAVAVVMNRRSQLPRAALNGYAADCRALI